MTKIILTRHGHVDGIKPERFRGRTPLELTRRGTAEAAALAQRIAAAWRPTHIYTSPMNRCIATAAAIAGATGIAARTCEDLNDIDYGAWQFKTFNDAKAADRHCSRLGLPARISCASPMANRYKISSPAHRTRCAWCLRAIPMRLSCWSAMTA